jgi:hypothetical protein
VASICSLIRAFLERPLELSGLLMVIPSLFDLYGRSSSTTCLQQPTYTAVQHLTKDPKLLFYAASFLL